MSILNTLASENYFIVNRDLIKNLGLESAVMLGELASEYSYFQKNNELENDWFYSTLENIEERTTLSKYNQNKIISDLKKKGIIETKLKGVPARRYIKINEDKLLSYLDQDRSKFSKLVSKNFNQLDSKNFDQLYNNNNNKNNNKEYKENTSSLDYLDKLAYNFNEIWNIYPNKKGRIKAYQYYCQFILGRKVNGVIYKLSNEQIYDAVKNYSIEVKDKDKQYILNGSTFFNTRILDYIS